MNDTCGRFGCPLGKEKSEREPGVCIFSKDLMCDYPYVCAKKHPLEKMLEVVPVMVKR